MKNCNIANINTNFKKLITHWLLFTRSFHNLSKQEIDILSLLIYYYFQFKIEIKNETLLWKMVFDYDTKMKISEELDTPTSTIANILTKFRKKNIIKDNQVLKNYIPNFEYGSNSYKLIFNFAINE